MRHPRLSQHYEGSTRRVMIFRTHRENMLRGSAGVSCFLLQYLLTTVLCSSTLDSGTPLVKVGSSSGQNDKVPTTFLTMVNTGLIVELENRTRIDHGDVVPWDVSDVRQEPRVGLTTHQENSLGNRLQPPGRPSYFTSSMDEGMTRVDGPGTSTSTQQNNTRSLENSAQLHSDQDATGESSNVSDNIKELDNSTQHTTNEHVEDKQPKLAAEEQPDITAVREQPDTTASRKQANKTATEEKLDISAVEEPLETISIGEELDTSAVGELAAPGSAAQLHTIQQSLNNSFPGAPAPVFNSTETMDSICSTENCDLEKYSRSEAKQSGTNTSAAQSEPLVGNTLSLSVLMPLTDNYFYLSSSTLQDLWQNHINAAAAVPMEIVETSANDLMEYYLHSPDPHFVVPAMTGGSPGSHALPSPAAPTRQVTDSMLLRPQHAVPSPTPTVPLYPLASPSNTESQTLPKPPLSTDLSSILYGSPAPSVYQNPSNVTKGQTPHNSHDRTSSQPRLPGLTNQSNLPVTLTGIAGKLPPQVKVKDPGSVQEPENEAATEALPGLHRQGVTHEVLLPNMGGRIRFPGQEFLEIPQNSGNAKPNGPDMGAVRMTPYIKKDDLEVGGMRPDSGDARLLIRITASDAVTTTQSHTSGQGNDQGLSQIDLGDGQRISIRVKGSPDVALSTKRSQTQLSSQTLPHQTLPPQPHPSFNLQPQTKPPQSRPSQSSRPRNRPHQHTHQPIRQPMTPNSMVIRVPVGHHPADDRLSVSEFAPSRSDLRNVNDQLNEGGTSSDKDHYQIEGTGSKGILVNKGGSSVLAGLFSTGNLDGIKDQLNKGFRHLQNLFSKEGLRGITGQLTKGVRGLESLFNKGGLEQLQNGDITSHLTDGVHQVNYKLQKLVDPFQNKVESSFTTAVDFLRMFFGHVLPTDYYDKILTVLAIIAFLAFVHVRISLMVTSLAQTPLTLSFFQKTSEFLKTMKENEHLQVIYELAKDVHNSIEHWTEAQLSLSSSLTSKIPFASSVSHFFGSSNVEEASVSPDNIFSQKTLFIPDTNTSDILPHVTSRISTPDMSQLPRTPETSPNTTGIFLGEVEDLARLGASLVDLTLEHNRRRWPPSGASCLQRPFCDLNTYSSTRGGLTGFVFPLVSTGMVWLARPPHDVFTFLDTFRPLWLSGSQAPGRGCPRIHTCDSHASPAH